MNLDAELIDELALLIRFRAGGRSVMDLHESPDPAVAAAAKRMFQKGLLGDAEDVELTDTGREAMDHLSALLNLLSPPLEPI